MKAASSGMSKFIVTGFHVSMFFHNSARKTSLSTKSDLESIVDSSISSSTTFLLAFYSTFFSSVVTLFTESSW